jgi:hypothetical protein
MRSPALLRPPAIPFVRDEVLERRQEERSEASAGAIDDAQRVLFQQLEEEALGQVFCVAGGVSRAAQVGIERIPVLLAESRQRFTRVRRGGAARREHECPPRRLEPRPMSLRVHPAFSRRIVIR